jgi:large exoprotein involved in heme utilization and adhesion
MTLSQIVTDSEDFVSPVGVGTAGNIKVISHDTNLDNSALTSDGQQRGGAITINADTLTTVNSQIVTHTNQFTGGALTVTGNVIELTNGSSLVSSTGGNGNAGLITVTGTDHVGLLRATPTDRPSGIFSNSSGEFGTRGNAGEITINTPRLEMTGGARINTTSATSGRGGNVTINVADSIAMSGETSGSFPPEPLFSLGTIQPSGIFTLSIGGHCTGPCGNAGNISVTTDTLTMGTGSQINSGTSSSGQGGNIAITARDTVSMSGTLSTGQPGGILSRTIGTAADADSGGKITLTAGQSVTISNGAAVSASSTGPGNAGNISINAGQQFEMHDSSITTQATKASGGNIDIQAVDRIRLVNSPISTSVKSGPGSGGNITIDPNVVVLQNSPITAQADRGAGGNITITTPLFLADSTSPVSASSQFGRNGTVTIQSPTSNLSESLGTLPSEPSQAYSLLTQRCAALANGQTSSFVVAGRKQLPADPGGWLSSPLALVSLGESLDAGHAIASTPAVMAMATDDTGTVSLRRLTPAGFLMASFADSAATGCHS